MKTEYKGNQVGEKGQIEDIIERKKERKKRARERVEKTKAKELV